MKKNLAISIRLSFVMIILCAGLYPLLVCGIGLLSPGRGKGETIEYKGRIVGYKQVGQSFTEDKYFQGRPSAVNYNSAGSGGSNKGPSEPAYLKIVSARIDTFLAHNPGIRKNEIPSELITASGSGLDPHISPAAAYIQVKRIARVRNKTESVIRTLVKSKIRQPWLGPACIHVLELNIALDTIQ